MATGQPLPLHKPTQALLPDDLRTVPSSTRHLNAAVVLPEHAGHINVHAVLGAHGSMNKVGCRLRLHGLALYM